MTRRWALRIGLLSVLVTTIGCDQVTKHLATAHLMGRGQSSYLGDTLRLGYAENRGAFLNLGADLPPWARSALFLFGTGIVLAVCTVVALRRKQLSPSAVGLSLVVAGGASNLVDRILRGAVVDFLNVGIGPVRTGIFNVADMAILAGLVMILLPHRDNVSGRKADP